MSSRKAYQRMQNVNISLHDLTVDFYLRNTVAMRMGVFISICSFSSNGNRVIGMEARLKRNCCANDYMCAIISARPATLVAQIKTDVRRLHTIDVERRRKEREFLHRMRIITIKRQNNQTISHLFLRSRSLFISSCR